MSLVAKVWTLVSSSMRPEPHSITAYWANPLPMPIVVPFAFVCWVVRVIPPFL
jgi:hypothetical protein